MGYRRLIRHFGDIHCRQGRHIFISIIGPSDLKGADRDRNIEADIVVKMAEDDRSWQKFSEFCTRAMVFRQRKEKEVETRDGRSRGIGRAGRTVLST